MKKKIFAVIIMLGLLVVNPYLSTLIFAEEDAEYHLKLADEYKKQMNYESAKAEYEKVAELDPKSWIAYTELANIYTMEKEFSKAKELCLKALDYNDQNYMALVILGGCYHELGEDPKKSEEIFLRSMAIKPNRAALQGLIGVVDDYEKSRRYLEAEELLSKLLSLNPPEDMRIKLEDWLQKIKKLNNK